MIYERRLNGASVDENNRAISATDLRPDLLSSSMVQLTGRTATIWSGLGGKVGGTIDAPALFRLGTIGGAPITEALTDGSNGGTDDWIIPAPTPVKFSWEGIAQLRVTDGEPERYPSLIDKLLEWASASDSLGEQVSDSFAAISYTAEFSPLPFPLWLWWASSRNIWGWKFKFNSAKLEFSIS